MTSTSFRRWAPRLSPTVVFCATAALLAAETATAQGRPPAEWSFTAGVGALYAPDYEGSNDYKVAPAPVLELSWRDRVRLTTKGGPGLVVTPLAAKDMKIDLAVRYDFGRDQDDNDALKGLGDIRGGAVAVGRFAYEIGSIEFGLELARDLGGDRDGLWAAAVAEYAIGGLLNERTRLSVTPHVSWADDNYMSATFGVTAAQAARSARRYAKYDAGGGFKDAGVAVGVGYRVSDAIYVIGRVDYSRLLGDAADSPLVKREGAANQLFGLIGVSYRW